MKFADKYELFDAVTTGRIEAFMGRDVASGERVLVHIFDAPVKKPDQPTVLWVMESFRTVAPEPPGLVIAAGRYGATSFAYLVTHVPEDAALRKWKEAYESSTAETREIPVERMIPPEPPAVSSPPGPNDSEVGAPVSFNRPANPPTSFFGLRPPTEIAPIPSPHAVKLSGTSSGSLDNDLEDINFGPRQDIPQREPGEFTKQFFVGSHDVSQLPANDVPVKPAARGIDRIESSANTTAPAPSFTPVEAGLPELGGFTALFRSPLKPEIRENSDSPKRIDAARKVDDSKSGDFTKFFQGPFDGERPAEIPDFFPNVSNPPPGKTPGEFTQIFGSGKDSPFAAISPSASPAEEPPLRTEPGSFTRSFSDAGQLSSTAEPASLLSETKGNGNQKPPAFAEPKWTEPVLSPVAPPVKPADPPIIPRVSAGVPKPSVQNGATQVFSVPSRDSSSSLPPPPSGPSEYTRIISGGMAGLIASEEKPVAEEGPGAGSLPAFKMAAPAVPAAPKMAAPPAPKPPAVPAAPKAPQLGALLPKPKASYLPMIIILNASLIIAVLLIVYFAIKR
jgi:hypothetical protein